MRQIQNVTTLYSTIVIDSNESQLVIMYSFGQGGGGPLLIVANEIDGGMTVMHPQEWVTHENLELRILRTMAVWINPVVQNPLSEKFMQTTPGTNGQFKAYNLAIDEVFTHFHVERTIFQS